MNSSGIRLLLNASRGNVINASAPSRYIVTSETGAVHEAPPKRGLKGLGGVLLSVVAGITLGSVISKDMASFLEENDLFVPSDDDDD